jgi:hypothetical protein
MLVRICTLLCASQELCPLFQTARAATHSSFLIVSLDLRMSLGLQMKFTRLLLISAGSGSGAFMLNDTYSISIPLSTTD